MSEALQNYPLAQFTRFRTGGCAEVFFQPTNSSDLKKFLRKFGHEMPVHILGLGSNILVRDGVVNGLVIRLGSDAFSNVRVEGSEIVCGAFAPCSAVAKAAADTGLGGFEFMVGIPGTAGGALIGNAGCFGGNVAGVLVSAQAIDINTGADVSLSAKDCELGYRKSAVPSNLIITELRFKGEAASRDLVLAKMTEIHEAKSLAQPVAEKTCGSTFKNPTSAPAWKLVAESGMQGLTLGGAQVSERHANFIINTGSATAADIEDLADKVRAAVLDKFGIMLEYEMKIIGGRLARRD